MLISPFKTRNNIEMENSHGKSLPSTSMGYYKNNSGLSRQIKDSQPDDIILA